MYFELCNFFTSSVIMLPILFIFVVPTQVSMHTPIMHVHIYMYILQTLVPIWILSLFLTLFHFPFLITIMIALFVLFYFSISGFQIFFPSWLHFLNQIYFHLVLLSCSIPSSNFSLKSSSYADHFARSDFHALTA